MTVIVANDSFLQLTPARVCQTSNLAGTYSNGASNNGVGATLVATSASALTIDSVVVSVNDRVLLTGQTNSFENGIYVVTNAGSSGISWVLQRAGDFQCIEQMHAGANITVAAGTVNHGSNFVFVEPVPQQVGVSAITFIAATAAGIGTAGTKAASDNASPTVASVIGAPVVANHLSSFADTAGSVKDSGVVMSGSNMIVAGNIQAGQSGTAGTVASFPATASRGSLVLTAVANTGNTNTIISNAAMGQATTVSIPDPGVASTNFLLTNNAGTQTIATGSLALTTGSITNTAGSFTAGSSGNAGIFTSFPPTAASGSFIIRAVNNGVNAATTLSNAAMGQATTISIPDPGAATANIVLFPQTDALFVNAPLVSNAAGVLSFNNSAILSTSVTLTTAQVQNMFATPVQIIAAPGAGRAIMVTSLQLLLTRVTASFADGGVGVLQYNNTANGAGTNTLTGTIAAANITAAASQIINFMGSVTALTGITNQGVFLSNQTGAFTGGGTSTLTCIVQYQVVTATV